MFDISDPENPVFLYATTAPTVTGWHSAAWSWDGSILVTGWEPGGGTARGRSPSTRTARFTTTTSWRIRGRLDGSGSPRPASDTSPGGRTNFRGGDWSSYWYNGLIYESDTRRGLFVWNVSAPETRGPTVQLDHLNPQTNQLSIAARDRN